MNTCAGCMQGFFAAAGDAGWEVAFGEPPVCVGKASGESLSRISVGWAELSVSLGSWKLTLCAAEGLAFTSTQNMSTQQTSSLLLCQAGFTPSSSDPASCIG